MPDDKGKILIIDDDPLLVDLYQEAFKNFGYEVETAFDGENAFKKLNEMAKKPTIVLSDIMMPIMNGLDLLSKMKAEDQFKRIPVVLLTNLSGSEDAKRGLMLGAIAYLVKSDYTPKEIVEKIKELLTSYHRDAVPEVKTVIKPIDGNA